jgi:hypothetical protein
LSGEVRPKTYDECRAGEQDVDVVPSRIVTVVRHDALVTNSSADVSSNRGSPT